MLLTIEKVALLKTIEIFADTPDSSLASVARIVEEIELNPGVEFITEGEADNCLYVVIEGEVLVHSHGQPLITLGPGKCVGELAILDPAPRSASVKSMNNVLLFRIDREPFAEVMADRPEISQGVIRALARRVREQGQAYVAEQDTLAL